MKIYWKIVLMILGVLVVVNLGVLDWITFGSTLDEKEAFVENKTATGSCELKCQEIIEEKIKEELDKLPSLAGQSPVPVGTGQGSVSSKTKTPTLVNGKPKIAYMPLVASGNMAVVDWADIVPSEFYFNLSDYPNVKEVRFEAYLSSVNGDQIFARLYDVTNKRGVDYSDLLTANTAFTRIESSAMKIWAGNNKYTVQLRSVNGTAVNLKDAKLKITY